MPSRRSFFRSSVGSKYLIAATGLCLVGFLILHLIGNILVFISADTFNEYGEKLIRNPLLIPAELGLAALFLLHAAKSLSLVLGARDARPLRYSLKKRAGHTSRKSWASTTMILSGLFLLLFVPFHLKTFKYGSHYESAEPGVRDLWRTVAEVFSRPGYVVFYVAGMAIIGFHLWHGVSSSLQSLGIDRLGWSPALRRIGWTVAVVLAVGFLSIPLYIYFVGAR